MRLSPHGWLVFWVVLILVYVVELVVFMVMEAWLAVGVISAALFISLLGLVMANSKAKR